MDSFERYISLPEVGFQGGEGIRVKGRILGEKHESQQSLGPFQILHFPQFSLLLLFPMYLEFTLCLVSACSTLWLFISFSGAHSVATLPHSISVISSQIIKSNCYFSQYIYISEKSSFAQKILNIIISSPNVSLQCHSYLQILSWYFNINNLL